jgi:Ca-activated chloride channel family protein
MAGPETASGDAIGVTVNRLKGIKSKSKIAILLTDGSNSAGDVDPRMAAKAANALGVKFYTIGAGGDGGGSSFLGFKFSGSGARIDEKMLQYIADETGGRYFRAKDTMDLVRIYETINALEKTEAETQIFRNYEEKYQSYLLMGLLLGGLMICGGLVSHRRLV